MNEATSIYLDLVRFLAAFTVFVVHANYDRLTGGLPLLWRLADHGNDAVMVFFVLSGFVIAYVADTKEKTPKQYYIARLARLYSVAAPALLLTVLLDFSGARIAPAVYDGWWFASDGPAWRFFASFFFIHELWFTSLRPFTNGPYWSLGYEFWYYVLFGLTLYLKAPQRYFALAAGCVLVGPKILLLFPIWLLGVWVYATIKTRKLSEGAGWCMFLGSAAIWFLYRYTEQPAALLQWTEGRFGRGITYDVLGFSKEFISSYVIGALVATHFIGLAAVSHRFAALLELCRLPIRYLAGYTFALYLFHYPLLQFFSALAQDLPEGALRTLSIVAGTLLSIWALGTLTERKKADLKRALLRLHDRVRFAALGVARWLNDRSERPGAGA